MRSTWESGRMGRQMVKVIKYIQSIGTFYYPNNEKYEGEWKDNNMCGHGKFILRLNRNLLLL